MIGGKSAKIRLVRCPKCWQILPELPDVPVYECGVCGTCLQAKILRNNAKSTADLHEIDTAQTNKLDCVYENKKSSGSGDETIPQPLGECLLVEKNARDRIISGSRESEELSGIILTDEDQNNGSAQNEPEHFDDALLGDASDCIISGSCESEEHSDINEPDEDQNDGSAQNEPEHFDDALLGDARDCIISGSCESEELSGINESDEDQNNGSAQNEPEHFEDALLGDARDRIISGSCESEEVSGINLTDEDQNNESAQNEPEHLDNVPLGDGIFLNEYHENGSVEHKSMEIDDGTLGDVKFSDLDQDQSDQNDSPYCENEQPRIINEVSSSIKLFYLENKESLPSGGGNSALKSNNERSTSAGAKAEEESNNNSDSSFGRTKTWNIIDTKQSSSINDTHDSAGKSMPSEVPLAPVDVQLKQPVQITNHLLEDVKSAGAFERTEFVNPSSELSDTLIDLSKSPTTRSSRAYYDDGISSCEEADGPLSNQNKYSFKSAHKPASSATSDERHRREKFLANSNYKTQNQLRDYASTTSEKAFNERKLTGLDHDNLLNPTSLCHQLGNRRLQRNEYPSQLPFYQKDSVSGIGSGGPSNQLHNEFHCKEIYNSQEKLVYTQQEKLKLLKMVQELQDQLSKSYSSNEKPNGRTSVSSWKDQQVPYCGNALMDGSYPNFNYYKYPARARGGNSWPQASEYSRMPFSAEATCFWQQVDHPLYCCSQDWQSSAQIPGSGLHCDSGFCTAHSGIGFYNFCGSFPSSPQRSVESEFLVYSHGAKSDAQRHRDHEVQKYSREKPHLAKRCIRPMAAGSPFITCTRCLNILHLPTDFLLSNGRCHQLRCGACLEVLKFTLLNKNHLLPYTPTAKAPPPSEVDEYSVATNRIICSSHSGDCPHVDPVSFSDDYEPPFCKSCYKNGETLHASHCNAAERNVSHGLADPDKGKKKILNEPQNKHKNVVEAYDSASSSSKKLSPDANESPAGGSSPLHRLMGYSSPSELINGCGASSSQGDLGDKNFSYYAGEGSRQRI